MLRGITFEVDRGETVALVGRSGAGKSTILKLINRMLEPLAGAFSWTDAIRALASDRAPTSDGLCASGGRAVPAHDGGSGTSDSSRVLRIGRASASTSANRSSCSTWWVCRRTNSRRAGLIELSGGQRQRVGVARALAADPPVVLMDEPFGALDPITRAELHREFGRIQRQVRKTIVLVTHDMREAFTLADRIGVLDAGVLIECGPQV